MRHNLRYQRRRRSAESQASSAAQGESGHACQPGGIGVEAGLTSRPSPSSVRIAATFATASRPDRGRDRATVERFLDQLGPERCEQIELVSCDMAASIAGPIAERLPKAERLTLHG